MSSFNTTHALESRRNFPGLGRMHGDQPLIFLDGPAGTQVPLSVAKAMSHYLLFQNANRGGLFAASRETDRELQESLVAFSEFLGANDPAEVIFGPNMTTLTFLFARSLAASWRAGDEIILSAADHDANIAPWLALAQEKGVAIKLLAVRKDDLLLDVNEFQRLLGPRTRLVALGCACNLTGGINPFREITALAKAQGAFVFLDAVHWAPHALIDVNQWGCDALGFSVYKFFGPHLGGLWVRRTTLESLEPIKVRPSKPVLPWSWMPGTQNHEAIVGGRAALDYLADLGKKISGNPDLPFRRALQAAFEGIQSYETSLTKQLLRGLKAIPGIRILGIADESRSQDRVATVSFFHPQISTGRLAQRLVEQGVCLWSGNFYALELSQQLNLKPEGVIRVGLVHYNLPDEVAKFIHLLESTVREFIQS